MQAPCQAPVTTSLRHAHRARHGPEMRVCQWDVNRLQRQRMRQLPPAGSDHVGRCGQARGTVKLCHHLACGKASIEEVGWELFRLMPDAASGRKKIWAELWKLHNALVLFNPAFVTRI